MDQHSEVGRLGILIAEVVRQQEPELPSDREAQARAVAALTGVLGMLVWHMASHTGAQPEVLLLQVVLELKSYARARGESEQ